jgi:UDP:flavonoid glycosyltransferase YjiC (YdhE family)
VSRFLFVVPPVPSGVRASVVVGRELLALGHAVAWVGHERVLDRVVPEGAPVFPVAEDRHEGDADPLQVPPVGGWRSPASLILLWNDFLVPVAEQMLPATRAAVEAFGPDAVVADQQALAGAAAAHVAGVPWATLVATSAGVSDPLGDLPGIEQRIRRRRRAFLRGAGLDDLAALRTDPQTSPHLAIVCASEAFTGPFGDRSGYLPRQTVFVGPCLDPPRPGGEAGRRAVARRPLALVALDSPDRGHRALLHRAAVRALSSLGLQAVLVAAPDLVAGPAADVLVVPRSRRRAFVERALVVVSDGDHDTVCDALAAGVPLVVAPVTGDQPVVADQVVRAGAGVRVGTRPPDPAEVRRAVETVLADVRIRRGARQIRDSFAAAPGASAAADQLERLAGDVGFVGPADAVDPNVALRVKT